MLKVIFGPNLYECERRLKTLIADDNQVTQLDMSEPGALERFKTLIQGESLFSDKSTIVVRYLADEKSLHSAVKKALKSLPDSTDLIIYLPNVNKTNPLVKSLIKIADDSYQESTLNQGQLIDWLRKDVAERGGEISALDSRKLVEWVGENQMILDSEVNKLLAYDKTITSESIEEIAVATPKTTIFQMLDAMVQGRAEAALALYGSLLNQNVDAKYVISMICWQAHAISMAVLAKGKDQRSFAVDIGMSPFVLGKASQLARKLTISDVMKLNSQILKVDEQLKIAPVDGERLVEQLIRRVAIQA